MLAFNRGLIKRGDLMTAEVHCQVVAMGRFPCPSKLTVTAENGPPNWREAANEKLIATAQDAGWLLTGQYILCSGHAQYAASKLIEGDGQAGQDAPKTGPVTVGGGGSGYASGGSGGPLLTQ